MFLTTQNHALAVGGSSKPTATPPPLIAATGVATKHTFRQRGAKFLRKTCCISALLAAVVLSGCASGFDMACMHGKDPAEIAAFIKSGNDPNKAENRAFGLTPLGVAAMYNQNPEIIKTLLENGADPNRPYTNGSLVFATPLQVAAFNNNAVAARALLQGGAKVNYVPPTQKPYSAWNVRDESRVGFHTAYYGNTPLQIALSKSNTAVAEVLRAAGGQ
ncbi:MAG: ankyrin repeat domain-containing protein [Puniceicoccales bacterium]|nr:ankyrin repeat domain-containing protein [Puniceicoccales bacterium]